MGAMEYICKKNPSNEKFMIAAFPSDESKIFDYNRVIKDLNGLSKDEFVNILSNDFKITKKDSAFKPSKKNNFGMYRTSNSNICI